MAALQQKYGDGRWVVFPLITLLLACGSGRVTDPAGSSSVREPVHFSGIVANEQLELPGTLRHPNSAHVVDGVIRIYCYSADYTGGIPGTGDQLRIDLVRYDVSMLGTEHVLVRLSRYRAPNETWLLTPADSTDRQVGVSTARFSPPTRRKPVLKIEGFSARLRNVVTGSIMEIRDAVITAPIEGRVP